MVAGRGESPDSVTLVYGLARTAYRDQFAQRDQQRTRCSALLAFAGILATLSTGAARDAHGSLLIFIGITALIAAAGSSSPASSGSTWIPRLASASSQTSISSRAGAMPSCRSSGTR